MRSDAPAASREPWNRDKIQQLLLEAGHIAERSKQDMGCELKADRSIVTRADREIEALFSREFDQPDQGSFLIGEETVGQKGEEYIQEAFRGVAYVVDPIDGTSPYAHHLPTWGISVGRMAAGRLTDGAVYLPDFGEMVLSEENAVVEGKLSGGKWSWRELDAAPRALTVSGLVAITQGLAKHGRVSLPNPVLVLGVAVVPMIGLLQERFQAYLGSVKLWDIAGALPLLLRKGYSVTVFPRGERRVVTEAVEASTYDLTPGSKLRWALQTDLLICHPGDEVQLRASFSSGDLDRSME